MSVASATRFTGGPDLFCKSFHVPAFCDFEQFVAFIVNTVSNFRSSVIIDHTNVERLQVLRRRTRQTLRSAEFGFFGVTVRTAVQTPRF